MTRLIVIFVIWAIISLISFTFLAVLLRRFYMNRKYRLLDSERERYRPVYDSIVSGVPLDVKEFNNAGRPGRQALEEYLFKALEDISRARPPEQCPGDFNSARPIEDIYRYFDELGYTDGYIKKLKEGNYWEQAIAADKLGRLKCRKAVPGLIEALGRKGRDVKNMAVHSLGAIGDRAALPHLIALLKESVEKDEEVSLRIIKSSLISFGEGALPDLMEELKSPVWQVRAAAADILGEIAGEIASPGIEAAFIEALSDTEQDIRAKAAKGLGKIRSVAALPHLCSALRDPFWVVRLHAARALGLIGDPRAIEAVKSGLVDRNWQVRRVAAEALGELGDAAYPALLEVFLNDDDRYAKEQAAFTLEKAGVMDKLIGPLRNLEAPKNSRDFADIKENPPQPEGLGSAVFRGLALKLKEAGERRCREAVKSLASRDLGEKEVDEAVEAILSLEG
ncbi:MAG: HEAT repeat domain-containing protein [Deltaproteobacteria bacterium]|nr:HEAT repeat domain-containing protein [Deltaproteobacteria bacterium]